MENKKPLFSQPTQSDVAKLAGVSQATVSHVLNDTKTLSITQKTRQRVLDVIDEIGYVPSKTARSLRLNKTFTIAAIIPDITNPFYPLLVRGIQDVTKSNSYDLIVNNTDGLIDEETSCLHYVKENRVDGIIIVPFHVDEGDLLEANIPAVQLIQKPTHPVGVDSVYIDNSAAAYVAVKHLIDHGHTKIGMIVGQEKSPPRLARIHGYKRALDQHNLIIDEKMIRTGDWNELGGYHAMNDLLNFKIPITAVFAANDLMAFGAMQSIYENKLKIPDDIAIVGFDDIPACSFVRPQLTTISQYPRKIGETLAAMLIERLTGKPEKPPRTEEMQYKLTIRGSA